ncbi:MAG: hypothetical protein Q9222_005558, partial [Ikaeria aurantiellina]
ILYIGVYIGEAVSGQIAVAFTRTSTPWNTALIAIGIVGIVIALLIRLIVREPPRQSSIIQSHPPWPNDLGSSRANDNNNNNDGPTFHIACPDLYTAMVIEYRFTTLIALALYSTYTFAQIGQIRASQGEEGGGGWGSGPRVVVRRRGMDGMNGV